MPEPRVPRITKDNYQSTLQVLWVQAQLIADAPIEEMLAAAERADTVAPVLDPTLYRDKAQALHEDIEMLDALRSVQVVLERLRRRKAGA